VSHDPASGGPADAVLPGGLCEPDLHGGNSVRQTRLCPTELWYRPAVSRIAGVDRWPQTLCAGGDKGREGQPEEALTLNC